MSSFPLNENKVSTVLYPTVRVFNALLCQASLQRQTVTDCTSLQNQQEKLEKLEKECIKLSQTQSQASVTRASMFSTQKLLNHGRRMCAFLLITSGKQCVSVCV